MKRICAAVMLFTIGILFFASGCRAKVYPTYNSHRAEGGEWYADIDGTKYVLWPNHNWILLDGETSEKIGNLDSERTGLYAVTDDAERNYIKVYEAGADAMHVPLVKKSLADEFSIDKIDAVKWTRWGIYADNLTELIGTDTVTDQSLLKWFRALSKENGVTRVQSTALTAVCPVQSVH